MKGRFALLFLGSFAVMVGVWHAVDVAGAYRNAVLACAAVVSPYLNGWFLEYGPNKEVFRHAGIEMPLQIQLTALSMALMPLVALIVATPGLRPRRMLIATSLGVLGFFLIHVVIVLLYPVIMNDPNTLKDTLGVFSGLVAFVVGPLGLWFAVTYPELSSLWQLQMPPAPIDKGTAQATRR